MRIPTPTCPDDAADALKLERLRAALQEGTRSPLVADFFIAKLRTRLDEKVRRRR